MIRMTGRKFIRIAPREMPLDGSSCTISTFLVRSTLIRSRSNGAVMVDDCPPRVV